MILAMLVSPSGGFVSFYHGDGKGVNGELLPQSASKLAASSLGEGAFTRQAAHAASIYNPNTFAPLVDKSALFVVK